MNQPNKPQNPDSLHVGETVDKLTDKLNKMHNSDFTGWSKDAKNGYLTAVITLQQLSEAGESKWIPISNPPKKDGVYMVWGSAYADTPMQALRCNYYKKVFRADNCNGVRTKNITHWQPLPSDPNESKEPEHMIMPCCTKCGGILIGIWETENKICSGSCRGKSKGTFEKLYTHEQVLAFGEKVKELAIQSTLDYLHKNTTASIVYIDPYDYSCGVDGAEVDYFAETAEELIPELSIDLNKIEI